MLLSDPEIPLQVRIEAFNPFVPVDAETSGIPVTILRFVLINRTRLLAAKGISQQGALLKQAGA